MLTNRAIWIIWISARNHTRYKISGRYNRSQVLGLALRPSTTARTGAAALIGRSRHAWGWHRRLVFSVDHIHPIGWSAPIRDRRLHYRRHLTLWGKRTGLGGNERQPSLGFFACLANMHVNFTMLFRRLKNDPAYFQFARLSQLTCCGLEIEIAQHILLAPSIVDHDGEGLSNSLTVRADERGRPTISPFGVSGNAIEKITQAIGRQRKRG